MEPPNEIEYDISIARKRLLELGEELARAKEELAEKMKRSKFEPTSAVNTHASTIPSVVGSSTNENLNVVVRQFESSSGEDGSMDEVLESLKNQLSLDEVPSLIKWGGE